VTFISAPRLALVASLASVLALGSDASALEPTACAAAYERAQILRRDAKLRDAREQLSICAQQGCPAFIVSDCSEWARDLDEHAPTVVIRAQDERGHSLTEVRVTLDGTRLLARLDGEPVVIDPGSHVLRFESESASAVEDTYVVRPGDRNRPILVRLRGRQLAAPPPTPSTGEPTGVSNASQGPGRTSAVIFGAVGIAGLAGFTYFGLTSREEAASLRAECSPRCDPSDVDSVKHKLYAADASLGVAVLSLGIATWLYLANDDAHRSPPKTAFGIVPTVHGGTAQVAVTF